MNDLMRPALYDSYHEIVPLKQRHGNVVASDVVGPVCESADCFGKNRPLPPVEQGDCLALLSAGAYGFAMASNYNARALPAEVLVHGRKSAVVRRRQRLEEIWTGEKIPVWV
jgi:diaminopimelate decarboxylase